MEPKYIPTANAKRKVRIIGLPADNTAQPSQTANKKRKTGGIIEANFTHDEQQRRLQRLQRFQADSPPSTPTAKSTASSSPMASSSSSSSFSRIPNANQSEQRSNLSESQPVVGYSTQITKEYLRLTSAVDPATVRPPDVLKKSLKWVVRQYNQKADYGTVVCSQLKSIRQDLMVQHIRSKFTVKVYETHARIALEKGDIGEFNQCQSQLKILYAMGQPGHEGEFLAYRLLYFLFSQHRSDVIATLHVIKTSQFQSDPGLEHAMAVRAALDAGNYHQFFQLYREAPNMNGYLLDKFVDRERVRAMCILCKAYMTMSLATIVQELEFDDIGACKRFLKSHQVTKKLFKNNTLQTKLALPILTNALQRYKRVDIRGQL
ncbi:SAC3/GANP/Nin1/mts3/eIF-3 p25 family-domain-containing protein [Gongronella butleri]|nr:SAC3/GANP/Nin1/mts3/eIF-3 p25 family-domain-containing protein [Gongronella butleri]